MTCSRARGKVRGHARAWVTLHRSWTKFQTCPLNDWRVIWLVLPTSWKNHLTRFQDATPPPHPPQPRPSFPPVDLHCTDLRTGQLDVCFFFPTCAVVTCCFTSAFSSSHGSQHILLYENYITAKKKINNQWLHQTQQRPVWFLPWSQMVSPKKPLVSITYSWTKLAICKFSRMQRKLSAELLLHRSFQNLNGEECAFYCFPSHFGDFWV